MSKQMSRINWGIVGCGDVAEVKSGPAFYKSQNSSLIAVMRRDKEKAADFAKRHGVPQWTDDAAKLISDQDINAIYIATPPSSHLDYALQAIEAGKNVYLEKPMVLNSAQASVLVDALEQSEVKMTVAHYRRALPVFTKVKELLIKNSIGKVSSAEIIIKQTDKAGLIAKSEENWRIKPEISGGGYFHDIAPHQIDLMYYYFGNIASIKKRDTKGEQVAGEVVFHNGVSFSGFWDFSASENKDSCVIKGENGSISFSFYNESVYVTVDGETKSFHFSNPDHVQQPMIEKTIAFFSGDAGNPCSVEEAAVVTRIMDVFTGTEPN